ncbi:MAG TPA: fluoride efflux transporter CrcB [Methylomirabilota bacterium]|nr:fluoride efflux transporter CrcB [Methylomirabilota bacterium]
MTYLWIAIGGALGSVARFWCSNVIAHRFPSTLPWGTIVVNISGSFLIGVLAALYGPGGKFSTNAMARQFLVVGFCGGYTTFSAFSMQTFDLARAGEWLSAGGNVFLSVALCLLATWLGFVLASSFSASR